MNLATLEKLAQVQDSIRSIGASLEEQDYRQQYHTDLSPLGWHVGHCSFIETYWLREIALGDDSVTGELHNLYFPENMPKPERGPALPVPEKHLDWCASLNKQTRSLLVKPPAGLQQHALSKNDYLGKFILQHHAQHLETMYMVLQQRALEQGAGDCVSPTVLHADASLPETVTLAAGNYRVGSEHEVEAFDNEVPAHVVALAEIQLAHEPVTNAHWLSFMSSGGYENPQYWSSDGWQWQRDTKTTCPEHWRKDTKGNWFGLDHRGPHELINNDPLYGINYFEAQAYINWLNKTAQCHARLLHEYEWEAAATQGLLGKTGAVWEWCENTFHPYEGFTPFPYDNYSKPWFDNKHFVLRGGSRQSCDVIKRPSFRNFYNADKRHIFAGLRLAFE